MKARRYWYYRIWEDLFDWLLGRPAKPQKRKRKPRNAAGKPRT